jgi:UDP-N-acetyl-D-glucosamine dehydrogenase
MDTFDVAVIGLGFTGLPMAVSAARVGFRVVGVDNSVERVRQIGAVRPGCGLTTVSEVELAARLEDGGLQVRDTSGPCPHTNVHVLCVPTPAGNSDGADLAPLVAAVDSVGDRLRAGDLVLLQSTCPPGTTELVVAPRLARRTGLAAGVDFHLAHSPVRIDPGAGAAAVRNVPRVVAGLTRECTETALRFLRRLADDVVPVASVRTAELVKVFENTFRLVNISLVNELAALCEKSQVDVTELLDAAATKPYGFLRHQPGPGAGGDCIPVSAAFFAAAARHRGSPSPVVDAAIALNDAMPSRILRGLGRLLGSRGLPPLDGRRVLVVGVTYKPDVANVRNSAAVRVIELLRARAVVGYHDPHVPLLRLGDGTELRNQPVELWCADIALVLTRHAATDHAVLARRVPVVVDCSGGLPHLLGRRGQSVRESDDAC